MNWIRWCCQIAVVMVCAHAITVHPVAHAQEIGGARMELHPQKLEFGLMKRGEKRRRTLQVLNTGEAPLEIESVRPSCPECVVDDIPKRTIPPGGRFKMPVTFVATDVPGEHSPHLTFHTNDARKPLRRIYLTVTIAESRAGPQLTLSAMRLDAGLVLAGEGAVEKLMVKNSGTAPLSITGFNCSKGIEPEGRPAAKLQAGAETEVKLRVGVSGRGLFTGTVTLVTDDPQRPVMTIPVVAYGASREEVGRLMGGVWIGSPQVENGSARVTLGNFHASRLRVLTARELPKKGWISLKRGAGLNRTYPVQRDAAVGVVYLAVGLEIDSDQKPSTERQEQ